MSPDDDHEGRTRAAVAAAIVASGRQDATIAKAVGKSRAMIGNYRGAKNTITLATAVALARALGITVDQLAGAEPLPERAPAPLPVVEVDGVRYVPASRRAVGVDRVVRAAEEDLRDPDEADPGEEEQAPPAA